MVSRSNWDKYYKELEKAKSVANLPEALINLLHMATIMVDIEFRKGNQNTLDWSEGRGYRVVTMKKVLPDQLTPAEKVLEGNQQELFV